MMKLCKSWYLKMVFNFGLDVHIQHSAFVCSLVLNFVLIKCIVIAQINQVDTKCAYDNQKKKKKKKKFRR